MMGKEKVYVYCFSVWPSETWGFPKSMFDLFRFLGPRVEMEFTEAEFERFRSELNHHGITLREIERTPHCFPESVQ